MSDNEIIKVLECHQFAYDEYMQSVIEHAISLIKRQKAEIESLCDELNRLRQSEDRWHRAIGLYDKG